MTVDGDERPLSPVRDLFQRDELAFEKGFEVRTVQIDRVWSVLEQHQGCEFTGLSIFVSYAIG